eukprot:GHVU01187780.1.p1 GENE.GHVU01187780.1~~GHVU01187780.1.p1  ORF type:complete len:319 (-),score=57.97 GHVU01187780.1:643-1599(-)
MKTHYLSLYWFMDNKLKSQYKQSLWSDHYPNFYEVEKMKMGEVEPPEGEGEVKGEEPKAKELNRNEDPTGNVPGPSVPLAKALGDAEVSPPSEVEKEVAVATPMPDEGEKEEGEAEEVGISIKLSGPPTVQKNAWLVSNKPVVSKPPVTPKKTSVEAALSLPSDVEKKGAVEPPKCEEDVKREESRRENKPTGKVPRHPVGKKPLPVMKKGISPKLPIPLKKAPIEVPASPTSEVEKDGAVEPPKGKGEVTGEDPKAEGLCREGVPAGKVRVPSVGKKPLPVMKKGISPKLPIPLKKAPIEVPASPTSEVEKDGAVEP